MSLGNGRNLPPSVRRAGCWRRAGPWGPLGHFSAVIRLLWGLRRTQDDKIAAGALGVRELILKEGLGRLRAPSRAGAPGRLKAAS